MVTPAGFEPTIPDRKSGDLGRLSKGPYVAGLEAIKPGLFVSRTAVIAGRSVPSTRGRGTLCFSIMRSGIVVGLPATSEEARRAPVRFHIAAVWVATPYQRLYGIPSCRIGDPWGTRTHHYRRERPAS